jgi:predicted nuclease of restriction endonuclease-like RecB superfamily
LEPSAHAPYGLENGQIVPRYLRADDRLWLRELIDEFQRFEGRPRRELLLRLAEPLAVEAPAGKLRAAVRVLDRIWEDRCQAPVRPRRLRSAVFEEAARTRDRSAVLARVGRKFGLAPAEVDELLFADVREERRLKAPREPLSPEELGLSANLALVQGLLRRASSAQIELYGNTRPVIRYARARGLLLSVRPHREGRAQRLEVSGPMVLFRRTRIYGDALAGLLPHLKCCHRFALTSFLRLPEGLARLVVRSGDPILPAAAPRPFDSGVEERFARDFARRATDWDVIHEPLPVAAAGTLIFPDFELRRRRDGESWLLEIVGFWTPEYLAAKLARLRAAGLERLILLIDHDRNCEEGELPAGARVLRYRRRIDPRAVLAVIDPDAAGAP